MFIYKNVGPSNIKMLVLSVKSVSTITITFSTAKIINVYFFFSYFNFSFNFLTYKYIIILFYIPLSFSTLNRVHVNEHVANKIIWFHVATN